MNAGPRRGPEPPPSLRHRLEYAVFRVFRGLLRMVPEPVALGLGAGAGWLVGRVLGVRREVVEANLARAFPERTPAWRRRVAVASWVHLGREAVATFRMDRLSAAEIRERVSIENFEALERAVAEGRGAVLVSGHLGNWEIGGAAVAARGLPIDAVAFRQQNRLFDRDLERTRGRLGMRVITRNRASREVLKTLREGRIAALVADQNGGPNGLFVDFFGVPASTARGPAVFALRTGAPLFVGLVFRAPGSRARYRAVVEEVALEPSGDPDRDVLRLTAAHTGVLERWIRQAPGQYFWQHKRWKTRPPGEDAGPGTKPPGTG